MENQTISGIVVLDQCYAKNIVTYLWIFEWHEEGEIVTLPPMFQVLMQENVRKLETHVRRTPKQVRPLQSKSKNSSVWCSYGQQRFNTVSKLLLP